VPLGLVASSTLVWHSSYSAFVGTTATPENAWQTGVVTLGNDRGATALFTTATEKPLVPGNSGYRCITVTYDGNVDTNGAGVRLYGALKAGSSSELAAVLQVSVEMSTTAVATPPGADCSGFPAAPHSYTAKTLSAFPADYGTGIGDANGDGQGDWRPLAATDRSRTYKISYSLPVGSYPDTLQGKQVAMTFTWEVRAGT
jgi:hypothetical protein